MSNLYLQRYLRDETAMVWAELTALGEAVRQEPLYSDALAVARETMRRARHNIGHLVSRLQSLGYTFAHPNAIYDPLNEIGLQALEEVEETYGPLPIALRAWYEEVGTVCLLGAHPRLSQYQSIDPASVTAPLSDPLFIHEIDLLGEPGDYSSGDVAIDQLLGPRYRLTLAPDLWFKSGSSGGGYTEVLLPAPTMDALLVSADWPGFSFTNYLRLSFQWGGFAALSLDPEAALAARQELEFLTADLLPI